MGEVIQAVRPDFAFLAGSGSFLFPALSIGAKGGVPGAGERRARECVKLYESFQRGDYETAGDLQLSLIKLNGAVSTRLECSRAKGGS